MPVNLSGLGEFGLIDRFRRKIRTDPSVVFGSGDDCAVLKFDRKNYQLFTCDMLVDGVDFTAKDDPYLVGRKALAVSVSDIASCSGLPRHCLISLGLPANTPVKYIDRLFQGMLCLAKKFRVNIAGGDLSCAKKLVIDVSMLGAVEKKYLTLRRGAKKGDIIFVTGSLGGSIYGKHLRFTPRVKEARLLAKSYKINAMIDISDGLLQDLGHILKASKAGAVLYAELIPLAKEARNLKEALCMGEDFELLFTASRLQAKKIIQDASGMFKPIGEITVESSGLRLIDKQNREIKITAKGFSHF